MLYRAIKNRSLQLELEALQGGIKTADVKSFIDFLVESIPEIQDPDNYLAALELLRKWETLYVEISGGEIYRHGLNYKFRSRAITNSMVTEHAEKARLLAADVSKKSKRFAKPNSEDADVAKFLASINPVFDEQLDKEKDDNKSGIAHIEHAYKISQIHEAAKICSKLLGTLEYETEDFTDAQYISWILHSKGNIANLFGYHQLSNDFYKASFVLKTALLEAYQSSKNSEIPEGFMLYSLFNTEVKLNGSRLAFPNLSAREIYKESCLLHERVLKYSGAIKEVNTSLYSALENNCLYAQAKSCIYSREYDRGIDYLRRNIELSEKLDDFPALVRATLNVEMYESNGDASKYLNRIEKFFDRNLHPNWLTNPVLKSLSSPSRIREYSTFLISDASFDASLSNIFAQRGIYPHSESRLAA